MPLSYLRPMKSCYAPFTSLALCRTRQKSSRLENFANFSRTTERLTTFYTLVTSSIIRYSNSNSSKKGLESVLEWGTEYQKSEISTASGSQCDQPSDRGWLKRDRERERERQTDRQTDREPLWCLVVYIQKLLSIYVGDRKQHRHCSTTMTSPGRKRKTRRSFSLCDLLVIVVVCGLSQKITNRFRWNCLMRYSFWNNKDVC